jgi:hypothetical protein
MFSNGDAMFPINQCGSFVFFLGFFFDDIFCFDCFLVELVSLLKICRVVVLFVGDWLSLVLLFLSSTSSFVRFVRSSSSSSSSLLCIYIVSTFQRGREHGGGIQMTFTEYYTKITALDMQSFPRFFRRRLYAHRIATNEKTEFKFHSNAH